MSQASRTHALLAYALSIVGALYVVFTRRRDDFALYHACQSLAIVAGALLAPVAWVLIAWLLIWVPSLGAVLSMISFSLVIAVAVAMFISWVAGMVAALGGRRRPALLVGGLARRLFVALAPAEGAPITTSPSDAPQAS